MVSSSFVGGLAVRAAYFVSSRVFDSPSTYQTETVAGIKTLQQWYDHDTGLWNTTGWWNAANVLTMLADYAVQKPDSASSLGIPDVIQNTYDRAQKVEFAASKIISPAGLMHSTYTRVREPLTASKRETHNFINKYYDDEGWWALALIRSHDIGQYSLGDPRFLQTAMSIFDDMKGGASSCGGIYWNKDRVYTNAIANELYLKVAASLANRVPEQRGYFLDIAKNQWNWFKNSGLINGDHLINDGLDDKCKNNGMNTWTYNQGVILGALVELAQATGDKSLLTEATAIATAAIAHKTRDGILYEGCEPNCGDDGAQFKGIFMRNLRSLHEVAPQEAFKSFLLKNADAIWVKDRNDNNELGPTWNGPFAFATAGTHSSAMDALVAAVVVA